VGIREISDLPTASDSRLKKAARATGVTFRGLEKLRHQALSTVEKRPVSRGIFDTTQEACMEWEQVNKAKNAPAIRGPDHTISSFLKFSRHPF